jgi:hypothetical protein
MAVRNEEIKEESDMSRMSDLAIDIEDMLLNGKTVEETAKALGIPTSWVTPIQEMIEEESHRIDRYQAEMDGDWDTAMASAGYGTDEDYGYYGEEAPF